MKKSKKRYKEKLKRKKNKEYIECTPLLPEFLAVDIKIKAEDIGEYNEQVNDDIDFDEPAGSCAEETDKSTKFIANISLTLTKQGDGESYKIQRAEDKHEQDTASRRPNLRVKKRLNLAEYSDSDTTQPKRRSKHTSKSKKSFETKNEDKTSKSKSRSFTCGFCGYVSFSQNNLNRHELTHTAEKTIPCDVCDMKFAQVQYMKTHRQRHFSTVRYDCEICDKQFTRIDNLRRHKTLHDEFRPYGCEICSFRDHTTAAIVTHREEKHADKLFPCSFCNKKYPQLSYLRNHILGHTEGRNFECDICGLSFAREETLTVHMRSHINTRPFPCFVCNRRFSRRHHLEIHSMSHTSERPYGCDECDSRFKHVDTLKKHKRKHVNPKEFSCGLCDKRFSNRSGLRSHSFVHTGDRPFKCDSCTKTFIQYKSLLAHKLTHRSEGPFECARCGRTFMTMVAFNKHVELSHKGEPLPERKLTKRELAAETIRREPEEIAKENEDRNPEDVSSLMQENNDLLQVEELNANHKETTTAIVDTQTDIEPEHIEPELDIPNPHSAFKPIDFTNKQNHIPIEMHVPNYRDHFISESAINYHLGGNRDYHNSGGACDMTISSAEASSSFDPRRSNDLKKVFSSLSHDGYRRLDSNPYSVMGIGPRLDHYMDSTHAPFFDYSRSEAYKKIQSFINRMEH